MANDNKQKTNGKHTKRTLLHKTQKQQRTIQHKKEENGETNTNIQKNK